MADRRLSDQGFVDLEPGDYWLTSLTSLLDPKGGRAIVTSQKRLLVEQEGGGWSDLNMPISDGWKIEPRSEAKAAPSLPAVDSPEDLTPELMRLAADVIEQTGGYNAEILIAVIRHLEHTADRVEREQAEKAKRDRVIEDLTATVVETWVGHNVGAEPIVAALLDRFDITPKP